MCVSARNQLSAVTCISCVVTSDLRLVTMANRSSASAASASAASAASHLREPKIPPRHEDSQQSGLLSNKTRTDVKDSDLYENVTNIQQLFGSLQGAALLEKCLEFYQADELDIPWFSDDGTRTVVRSELSRPIQEATVSRYMTRIWNEGLSQMVSGQPIHAPTLLLLFVHVCKGWVQGSCFHASESVFRRMHCWIAPASAHAA